MSFLTNEQLVLRIKAGENTAANMLQLWEQNKGFIYKIALKYQEYEEIDDLMQQGYLGLYDAIDNYDPSQGVKFITYAGYWIKQSMTRYIDNYSSAVRISVPEQEHIRNYKKVVLVMMFIILLLVALTIVAYYRDVEIVTNISLSFIIACTTGVVIEVIHGAKERDSRNIIELKKELEEMRYKIINFRRNLNKLSRNRNRYNFYNNADRLMEEASRLNEEKNINMVKPK